MLVSYRSVNWPRGGVGKIASYQADVEVICGCVVIIDIVDANHLFEGRKEAHDDGMGAEMGLGTAIGKIEITGHYFKVSLSQN